MSVALTTEAQPPSFIQVGEGRMIKVLGHAESHKWLGCMLCACPGQDSDVEYHLQQAAKAFQKHRWMLQCKDCSVKHRLRYFEAVVSSTACFAAEHRPLYRKHLEKYDIQFRKFVRRIVGPPPGTNWSAQWHEILHEWNMRVDYWVHASGISSWSKRCMTQYWNFASYIANLPAERWVRRALAWQPLPTHPSRGRPQPAWDTKLEMFCRYKTLGNWEIVARNAARWDALLPCFLDFCSMWMLLPRFLRDACRLYCFWCIYIFLFRLRPYIGLAYGRWGWLDLTMLGVFAWIAARCDDINRACGAVWWMCCKNACGERILSSNSNR